MICKTLHRFVAGSKGLGKRKPAVFLWTTGFDLNH